MVYNYKKQRSPIVPMYTILGTNDGVLEKNGVETKAAKQQIRKIEDTPGPNMYNLGGTIGSQNSTLRTAPKFTFGERLSSWCADATPGPMYNLQNLYRPWDNAPTMTKRNWLPRSNGFPGPHYSLGHVTISRNSPPKYSFGIRHSLPRAPIIVDKPE